MSCISKVDANTLIVAARVHLPSALPREKTAMFRITNNFLRKFHSDRSLNSVIPFGEGTPFLSLNPRSEKLDCAEAME